MIARDGKRDRAAGVADLGKVRAWLDAQPGPRLTERKIPMTPFRLALPCFSPFSPPALALDYKLGAIEIGQPWTRATPPTAESGGGFLLSPIPGQRPTG